MDNVVKFIIVLENVRKRIGRNIRNFVCREGNDGEIKRWLGDFC